MKAEHFMDRKKYCDVKLLIEHVDIVQYVKSYFRYYQLFIFHSILMFNISFC